MEHGFAATQHTKFCYRNQLEKTGRGTEHAGELPKKEKPGAEKEVCHKSIWRSFNIFAKIKKSNRGRTKEAAETIEKELITIDNQQCKTKEMDDDKLNKSDCNENVEEDNASIESKSSFFGKMNLENLLKIFVDLHKKKQLNQNSINNKESITDHQQAQTLSKSDTSETESDDTHPIVCPVKSDTFSLKEPEQLQNPFNSPSLMNARLKNDDSQRCSTESDAVGGADSTLSLLNNVSIKLKDYLMSEAKDEEQNRTDESELVEETQNEMQTTEAVEEQSKIVENQQSDSSKDSGDKKMAYTIVETDIKRMIKELLEESKDLKNSIVATGVEEEPTVSFTQLSKSYDSFFICRNLCNDLINMACNTNAYTLKNRKHLNVTFRQDNEKDVESILTTLVENVLNRKCPQQQQMCINFCLVQTNFKNKSRKNNLDSTMIKFRESNVYILTKKLRKLPPGTIIFPPKVTVHNLSTTKRIKLIPSENSLINRVRRSAALLMALYDEMRDYSYYSCTSNILCDLYGSMIKQGLISLTNLKSERSIQNVSPAEDQTESPRSSESTPISSTTSDNPTTSSYSTASKITEVTTSSNDSSSSESEDDTYATSKRDMLPNLKYTYQSDEEVNTPEEIKWIDENVIRNGACRDMNIKDVRQLDKDSASDKYPYVSINEEEAFLKK